MNNLIDSFVDTRATTSGRQSLVLLDPTRAERTARTALGWGGYLGMLPMFAGILGWAGGGIAPKDKGQAHTGFAKFREGLGNALAKPVDLLNRPLFPNASNEWVGGIAQSLANGGETIGLKAMVEKQRAGFNHKSALDHKGFGFGNLKTQYPELLEKQKKAYEGYRTASLTKGTAESTIKAAKEAFETSNQEIKNAVDAAKLEAAPGAKWYDISAKFKRGSVDSAVRQYDAALKKEETLNRRVEFFQNPAKVAQEAIGRITAQDVISAGVQAVFIGNQIHSAHVQTKAERLPLAQALYDMTGVHYTKSQLRSLKPNQVPEILRKELANYKSNKGWRAFFVAAEAVLLPVANRQIGKLNLGGMIGTTLATMGLDTVSNLVKGRVIKESDLLPVYTQLHAMEHQGMPIQPVDMLPLLQAASPELAKKPRNAQLLANYFVHAGCSLGEVMKHLNEGTAHLQALSHEAEIKLIVEPQQAYERQQQAALEQQPSTKWRDMARNGMRAVKGGQHPEVLAETYRRA